MADNNIGSTNTNKYQLVDGLSQNIEFHPVPGSVAFQRLSPADQQLALNYYQKEAERTEKLEARYLQSIG